ncbi:hypothetical protein BK634_07675 [Pseudomonas chlororaphis]|nr:hypothetical protein BK634_07675 [Pseudomonas chlororaphis]
MQQSDAHFRVHTIKLEEPYYMLVELSPVLLTTLERVNALHMELVQEDDVHKAKHLREEHGRERTMLLILLNEAVAASQV